MVWVAESKGYFQEQGLDVQIKDFDSGKNALKLMLDEGNLDMVTAAQAPVVFNSFSRNDYAIISAMVYSNNDTKILCRQDKGIKCPSDLMGKKIGITAGSTGHFTTKTKGIGLGLVACQNIINAHQGRIEFESKKEQGTTFMIKLPVA